MVSLNGNLTKLGRSNRCFGGDMANRVKRLIKTFIIGVILGLLGTGALAWYVPAVDIHRERSLVSVQPNGGNIEVFHINLPRDRIMVGLPNVDNSIPAGLEWPGEEYLGDMQAELFKIRNSENTVIGVASRLASASGDSGPFIEWAIHLPARGTIYAKMEISPSADGFRNGVMLSGSRDFSVLSGSVREQFIADASEDADVQGRIRLEAALVGQLGDEE
jgi:hypothetical protein